MQKLIGWSVAGLSVFTIVNNIVNFQTFHPFDSFVSISVACACLVWYVLSVFIDSVIFRIGQVVIMALVGIMTIVWETNTIVFTVFGFVFLGVSIASAWAYEFFDSYPKISVGIAIAIIFFSIWVLTGSAITAGAMTLVGGSGMTIIGLILSLRIKKLQQIAREAVQYSKHFDEQLQERLKDGEIK